MRTAPTRSVPRICFSTYPAAPAMIASNNASSSPNEVSIRQATSGIRDRISRHTDTPSPSGSRTSRTATSGFSAGMRASAEDAVPGLADHLDVRFGLQQVADAPADNLVVIEEKHRDRLPGLVAGPRIAHRTCHRNS